MLRILVVDDEPRQRRILSRIVSSHDESYEVVEAKNGEEALAMHHQQPFDIMFVDIRMPVMDGLELLERVRKTDGGRTQAAIISGYGEFAYAQKAIGLQVTEYLLKPIEEAIVLQVLERMLVEISKRKVREVWAESAQETYAAALLRRYFSTPEDQETAEIARRLLPKTTHAAVLCVEWEGTQEQALLRLGHRLSSVSNSAFVHEPNAVWGIAVIGANGVGEGKQLLEHLQEEFAVESRQAAMLWIGAGSLQPQRPEGLRKSYQQAQTALSLRFYYPEQSFFTHDQAASRFCRELSTYPKLDDCIFSSLYSDGEYCLEEIEEWVRGLTGERLVDPEVLLLAIGGTLQRQQHSLMERMLIESPADLPALELLYECRSLPEACQWLYQYLSHTQDVIQDALQTRHHSILERCIERMELEFDPDLSLSVVADWCHFSPSYFSKLFKEHTGESFTDYLVALRMTKAAAKLKNSHKKVYEIAEEVGYRDVKYFTRIFKKVYGVAPNEYRTMGPPPPRSSG